MATVVLSGPTIISGESLSNILTVASGGVYRIMMPIEWTPANITFQLSYDGIQFYNIYNRDGTEVEIPCVPNSVVALGEYLFYIHSVKVRSGTHRQPIAQTGNRTFGVVLDNKVTPTVGMSDTDIELRMKHQRDTVHDGARDVVSGRTGVK